MAAVPEAAAAQDLAVVGPEDREAAQVRVGLAVRAVAEACGRQARLLAVVVAAELAQPQAQEQVQAQERMEKERALAEVEVGMAVAGADQPWAAGLDQVQAVEQGPVEELAWAAGRLPNLENGSAL